MSLRKSSVIPKCGVAVVRRFCLSFQNFPGKHLSMIILSNLKQQLIVEKYAVHRGIDL